MKKVRWKATGHVTEIKGKGALTAEVDVDTGSHRYQIRIFFDGVERGEMSDDRLRAAIMKAIR